MSKKITKKKANHIVRQFLFSPSEETFKLVFGLIEETYDEIAECCDDGGSLEDFISNIDKGPIIGHVIGSLYKYKKGNIIAYINKRILISLRKLYRFERSI